MARELLYLRRALPFCSARVASAALAGLGSTSPPKQTPGDGRKGVPASTIRKLVLQCPYVFLAKSWPGYYW